MFAFGAIVAADSRHPVPSSPEHASASASRTRRSLPNVGEFAQTQFITAMLMLSVLHAETWPTNASGHEAPPECRRA